MRRYDKRQKILLSLSSTLLGLAVIVLLIGNLLGAETVYTLCSIVFSLIILVVSFMILKDAMKTL